MLNFTVIPRGIACEHFDDETIILNLPKGHYYSLKGSGQFIWSQLENNTPSNKIVSALSDYYGIPTEEAQLSVETFLNLLVNEELIIQSLISETTNASVVPANTSGQIFSIPVLEVFTDMQELLMLDPIHDADPGKGWPHTNNV